MVQQLEELRGSGTAPYSDASCAVESLHSEHYSCMVRLSHAPIASTSADSKHIDGNMYTSGFISMHAATYYFGLLGGRTFD